MTNSLINSTVLFLSIVLIAIIGINTGNNIITIIGGFCAAIFISIIIESLDE